jgi:HEAT repeat protein
MEILRESLNGGDSDERRAAATALGRVGSDDARDALVSALASSDSDLRSTALGALASYRLDDAACSAIRSAALSDPDLLPEGMRRLLQAGSSQGLELARSALSGDANLAIRTLGYLAEMNPPGGTALIAQSARASDERVRASALRALAQTHAPEALDVAINALHDTSYRVRETAASTLSGVGGDRARDALIQLSRSSDPNDRITAVSYFPDDAAAVARTRELLRDSDSSVVWSAMRSLASSPSGAPALRSLVFDASRTDEQRYDAAQMLENYGRLDDATATYLARARERNQYNYYE